MCLGLVLERQQSSLVQNCLGISRLEYFLLHDSYHLLLKCCFMSTETVGLLGPGAQDGHLDFHTAPELCSSSMLLYVHED